MPSFENIALASTFSPRFLPLLAEAKAFAELLGRGFSVIHAGEQNAEREARFAQAFAELGIDAPIHWLEEAAGSPAQAIARFTREQNIDLLIAGALEKETATRHFLGKVARTLMREAPCSLLFFTKPSREPKHLQTIAAVTDFSELSRASFQAAVEIAERARARSLHVLRIFTVFAQVLAEPHQFIKGAQTGALGAEEARLEQFIAGADRAGVPIQPRCIEGTTGFAASDYVQAIEADLLVIPAAPPGAEEIFPARMEWLHNVIPANLLVFRAAAGRALF